MKAMFIAAMLFISMAAISFAADTKCHVCGKAIQGTFYFITDKTRGEKLEVCTDCAKLETRCFSCGLPVKKDFTTLTDGRLLCTLCAKDAVLDDEQARRICLETREELDRNLSRFLSFPQTNVVLTIVDKLTLEGLFKPPGHDRLCASIYGATTSRKTGGRYTQSVGILSGLNKSRLEAVAAHEFAHTWLNENLKAERKAAIAAEAIEGFCELIAYNLMEQRRDEFEKNTIKSNPYTRGQIDLFIAAANRHGFNDVLDWMKFGEAQKLDAADPDRIRAVRVVEPSSSRRLVPANFTQSPLRALPETLKLKNISGSEVRRFAIINDRTFCVSDSVRIALAKSNVLVHCLEIRTNSVLIQLGDSGEKQELFLPENQ